MIVIVVKFDVESDHRDSWTSLTKEFTAATRAEPGNRWFEWFRSVDNPAQYLVVEGFRDERAGAEHVNSEHFRAALKVMRPALSGTPQIIRAEIDGDGWSELGELRIESTAE